MTRKYIKTAEILRKEVQDNKVNLIVNLVSVEDTWYVASITMKVEDRSMDSWKISRIKKGKPLSPLHPYKKCRFCDKNHFIGDCQFTKENNELLKELYYEIRLKSIWS